MSEHISTTEDGEIDRFLEVFETNEEQLLNRLALLEFTITDSHTLADLRQKLRDYGDQLTQASITYIDELVRYTKSNQISGKRQLLEAQIQDLPVMLTGRYDKQYVRSRIAAGLSRQKSGVTTDWYFTSYRKCLALLNPIIWNICKENTGQFNQYLDALNKVVFFDIGISLDTHYFADKHALNKSKLAQSQHQEQLFFHKNYDGLTGLPNRFMLNQRLEHILQFAKKKATTVALIQLGLDHFRMVKDSVGFAIGDLILKGVAGRLRHRLHEDDLIAYNGGDSFIIVIKDADKLANTTHIYKRINEIVTEPFVIDDQKIHLSCSMGIALYPHDCQDIDGLLKSSDSALNLAKEMGGNNFQFFNSAMDVRSLERMSIASELYNAIESQQFRLYYQPVADLQSGKIVSMEALIRWIHPLRGIVPPSQFIPIAEELSIINKLGNWIIRQACLDIREWQKQGITVPHIAINVSPKQLQDPLFTTNLLNTLTEMEVDPHLITLEITESMLMNNIESIESLLKDFKSHGMSLSMDDFGTGYSALAYLKHYPFDYVKIDQSFVRDIMTNSGDAAISNAVISMAHSMGIRVIAEGVETEAQCDFLSKNMCDLVQGYYLSQPVPPDQAGAFIQTQFCLPEHLLRIEKTARTLLVVDDEQNILASLKRLFRRDAYVILTANSGKEGLEILKEHKVDVIISDQRMPAMTGVDFLRQAKAGYPDTVRIVLSGYTELQSITDAINEGSIYKFLTKPWEDEQLRDQIKEAFQHKEMSDENRKLGLKIQTANHELATANRRLAEMLQQKEHQINRDGNSLEIAREALQAVPIPLIGVDEDGMIAFANAATEILFIEHAPLLGAHIDQLLPDFSDTASRIAEGENFTVATLAHDYQVNWRNMGESSRSRGKLITFFRNG